MGMPSALATTGIVENRILCRIFAHAHVIFPPSGLLTGSILFIMKDYLLTTKCSSPPGIGAPLRQASISRRGPDPPGGSPPQKVDWHSSRNDQRSDEGRARPRPERVHHEPKRKQSKQER